jgi:hypothetical protein
MKMAVFWVVAPYRLVEVYRGDQLVFLTMEAASTSKTSVNFYLTKLRKSQKTTIVILAAVRT